MEANFEIKGLDAINEELKRLPEDFRTKALNGAVGTATRLLRDEAIKNVPKDTGNLATSIRAQKKKAHSKYIGKYQVNLNPKGKVTIISRGKNRRSNSTYYARFIEEGTAKMPARPFIRPAFDSKKEESIRLFKKILDKKVKFYQRKIERMKA